MWFVVVLFFIFFYISGYSGASVAAGVNIVVVLVVVINIIISLFFDKNDFYVRGNIVVDSGVFAGGVLEYGWGGGVSIWER